MLGGSGRISRAAVTFLKVMALGIPCFVLVVGVLLVWSNLVDISDIPDKVANTIAAATSRSDASNREPPPPPPAIVAGDLGDPEKTLSFEKAEFDFDFDIVPAKPVAGPIPMPRKKPDMWENNYMVGLLAGSNSFGDREPQGRPKKPRATRRTGTEDAGDLEYVYVWRSCLVPDAHPICIMSKSFRQDPDNWPTDYRTAQERRERKQFRPGAQRRRR